MAAAKLVTRCPACRTAFRLVADQLRLRQGLVRCGQCDTVFDAREHLIEVPAPAAAATPTVAKPAAVTLSEALAHAEQTQAASHARENEAPFEPGFDPGYEVPALDSPTTMMSEPSAAEDEALAAQPEAKTQTDTAADAVREAEAAEVQAEAEHEVSENAKAVAAQASSPAEEDAASDDTPETMSLAEAEDAAAPAEPAAPATDSAPAAEAPLTEPPTPWPTLNHSAFDDEPARPAPASSHSSLDPAAAFAPKTPSGMPPSGAYSPKGNWPPLRPAETPHPIAAPAAQSNVPLHAAADVDAPTAATENIPPRKAQERQTSADKAADALPAAEPFPHTEPVPSASGFLRTEDPADPEAEAWAAQAKAVIANDLHVTQRDGTPDAVARETTTRHWLRQDTGPSTGGPVFAPDLMRRTRDREPPRTQSSSVSLPSARRGWARAAAVVLAVGVLVQGAYLARSQIAGSLPVLRPVLEAACAPFGCDVPPWRDLDALRIDSSQLQKQDEAGDVYQLAVTLRNQGRATTALPAIELVMTDLQDQLLLRRVLLPAEYLDPTQRGFAATGLRAGSELPVRVRFRTQQAAANYRVLIFYP